MSERQGFLVRNGFVATCAFAVVVLLMLFYSTVTGAVDRAARHRADVVDGARSVSVIAPGARPPGRSVVSLSSSAP